MKAAGIESRASATAILYAFFINQYFATTWIKLYSKEQYCIKTRTRRKQGESQELGVFHCS
jgi:hypothetical protein